MDGQAEIARIYSHISNGKFCHKKVSLFVTFRFWFLRLAPLQVTHTASPIWTNESSKRVARIVFWGLNDVFLSFGDYTPKNWLFGGVNRTFKPQRQKHLNPYNLKILSRTWQSFLGGTQHECDFTGSLMASKQSNMQFGGHLELRKMLISRRGWRYLNHIWWEDVTR